MSTAVTVEPENLPTVFDGEPVDFTEMDLTESATSANKFHALAQARAHTALEAAWYAGSVLLEAKARCGGHGKWLPWLEANFRGSTTRAQSYMRIASNTQTSAHLDPEQSIDAVLKAISKPRKPKPKPKPNRDAGVAIYDRARDRLPAVHLNDETYRDYQDAYNRLWQPGSDRRFELDEIARRAATLYGKTVALHERMKAWEERWRDTTDAYELEQIGCISDHLAQMQKLLAEMSGPRRAQ
jgi:hypothetical protein